MREKEGEGRESVRERVKRSVAKRKRKLTRIKRKGSLGKREKKKKMRE